MQLVSQEAHESLPALHPRIFTAPDPQAPDDGNQQVLQWLPERGQGFHVPTPLTLRHRGAFREGGQGHKGPSSFLQGAEEEVMNKANH